MLFAIGTRVQFKHTGDRGIVQEWLDDGMVGVFLEGEDMVIPVFADDLIRVDAEEASPRSTVKARIVPARQATPPQPPPLPKGEGQYAILKSLGLQLGFLPIRHADGHTEQYEVWLINDTPVELVYSVEFGIKGSVRDKRHGRLPGESIQQIGALTFDQLNDSPFYAVECWQVTVKGTTNRRQKTLRIKPQQFFRKVKTAPILDQQVHWYLLFDPREVEPTKPKEDLQTYTKKNARPWKYRSSHSFVDPHDVQAFAEFLPEIDLHIERLSANHAKMSNAEIVRLQLARFDEFLAKAIHLGIPRVFAIHGVGKGRLRDLIASRLLQNPDVITFRNEFHPRYGFGATEIVLQEDQAL